MEARLKAVAEASAHMFAARSLDETLRLATEAARDIVRAHMSVTSLTTSQDWAQAIVSVSLSDKYAAWRTYDEKPSGKGIYAALCRANKPMRLTQAELEAHPAFQHFGAAKGRHPPLRGWLAAPLVARDGANLGLIQLSDKCEGEFDAGDEAILVQLARLAAVAIENQRLVEAAQAAERRFEEFAKLGNEVLWETDAEHRYTLFLAKDSFRMNSAPQAYLGKTRWEAALGDPQSPLWAQHIAEIEAHRPVRNFEYPVPRRDGSTHYLRVNADPKFDAAGNFLGYRGATLNVTDLRRAEAAAKASEERFRQFAGIASDWLWETDAEHRFTYFAGAAGTTPDQRPYGQTRWELVKADLAEPQWRAHLDDLAAGRPFRNFEYTRVDATGRTRYISVSGQPIRGTGGALAGYRGTATDLTVQREAQAEARKAAEQYRTIVEGANEGLWIFDRDVRIEFANRRGAETLGYAPEEVVGRSITDFVPPDRVDEVRRNWESCRAGKEGRFEARYRHRDGHDVWLLVSAIPRRDAGGAFIGAISMFVDISDRKRAEAALMVSEQRYRNIVEIANEGIWILDSEARTLFANRRMGEMLGYKPEDMIGRAVSEFRTKDESVKAEMRWRAHKTGAAEQRETQFTRRDGTTFWALLNAQPMFDAAGKFVGSLGMLSDITARKHAEDALKASEDRFRDFAEVGTDWIWETDSEHRMTMLDGPPGRAADFAFGKRRWEYGGVDPNAPEWRRHRGDLDLHLPFRNFEYHLRDTEGAARYFSISGKPLFDANGAFTGYRGTTRDITAQRVAETKLRASEERFRDFAQVSSDWMWETDAGHRFSYFSPSRDSSQPDSSHAALGKTRWGFAGGDVDDPRWKDHVADLEAHRPFHAFEYAYRRPDGSAGTYVVSGVPIFADDGAFLGYRGTTTDITPQRAAEAAARESERKFRNIVETAYEGIWMLDIERRTTYVNPRMAEMLGYAPEEMQGRHHWDFMAAADRARAIEATRQRPGGKVERVELAYLRKDGSPIWVIVTSNIIDDPLRGAVGVLGMVTDITDRKKAEDAAARAKREVDSFLASTSDGVSAFDNEWRFTYLNPPGERITGLKAAEVIGVNCFEKLGAVKNNVILEAYKQAKQDSTPISFSAYSNVFNAWHEVRAFPSAEGITAYFRDITAERASHLALAESERKFRRIVETANEGLWITDRDAKIVFANRRLEELLGYDAGELVGKTIFDTIPKDRIDEVRAHRGQRSAGRVGRFEARHLCKDGSEITMLLSATPMYDGDGAYAGSFAMFVDISAQRRVQAALEESERKLRAALENNESILASISDGFVALDNDWRFTFINPAAERMWNKTAEELLGKTILNSLQVDPRNPFQTIYLESKRSGEPVAFAAHSALFDKWIEARGYPHPGGYTIFFDDVTEERSAHRALLKSKKKLEAAREMNERIFETSLDFICITDRTANFLQINPGMANQLGYAAHELVGRNGSELIHPDELEATRAAIRQSRISGTSHTVENRCRRRDGQWVPVNWSIVWSERERSYFMIGRNMSERIEAQERLNRSQRLEAIGQLTGGIAHDFNNLLTVIMGNSDTLARGLADREKLRRRAELSLEAARRAAELTAQLLAFARRQTLAPKAVDANNLVRDLHELMQRSLGAQVEVEVEIVPGAALWLCKVDSTQLETALLNLALNARDAMPGGGRVTIATSNRTIAGGANGAGDLAVGDYVAIEVADTGTGMAPDVLARAFEPFFTTKDIGKGSGLGLAMVYGFVKQSGGSAAIESEPGRGTKVTLYLPRAEEGVPAATAPTVPEGTMPGGKETILVVEDDAAVRELVTDQLRTLGYRVLVAGNGPTARNILYGGDRIDLLFTDIMMPGGISGTQLADEAGQQIPGLRILFTTGYSEVPALKNSRRGVALLRKPYKTRDLARTVREMLDVAV